MKALHIGYYHADTEQIKNGDGTHDQLLKDDRLFPFPSGFPCPWSKSLWPIPISLSYPSPQEFLGLFFLKAVLTRKGKERGWIPRTQTAFVVRDQVARFPQLCFSEVALFRRGHVRAQHWASAPLPSADLCSLLVAWLQYYKSRISKV